MRTILSVIMGVALASLGMAQPSPPYSFQVYTDIAYYDGPDAHPIKHRLDLFVPEGLKDAPVLIFVHGGGWTSGDKNLYSFVGRAFAEQGFVTAVINYRLSPQVQHPAHIEDVARAFAWVYRNIAQYGGNPEKIFVMGHSAGGTSRSPAGPRRKISASAWADARRDQGRDPHQRDLRCDDRAAGAV
jgi:acetyl esterase/lipase